MYDGYSVADIYIRHDCDVVIDVNGCAKVFVTVYDRANVKVRQGGMGRVYVYKNGDSCIVETEGSVTMRERKIYYKSDQGFSGPKTVSPVRVIAELSSR